MRPHGAFLFSASLLLLSSCAGGPGPDLNGPDGSRIMEAYSGNWTLLRLESDDIGQEIRGAAGARGAEGFPFGPPNAGGASRRPARGGMPGGRGTRVDPELMHARLETVRALAEVPEEMTLSLQPDRVTFTPADQPGLSFVLGAEEESFMQGELRFFARARWMKKGLVVEKEVDEGFAVEDEISLDGDGRLVMNRKVHLMGRSVEGTLVYRREES